ncbi:MAG TPA: hypothetical protein VHG89_04075 [Verrucomicrobiae bacterium]|nr:hypothetical protein [Verrucomicrobiae bacterium]
MKKFTFQLALIFCAVWFSGCKTPDSCPTYEDVHGLELVQGEANLAYLKALESGDLAKVKQMVRTQLFLNISFLPTYAKKFKMSAEEKIEADAFAKNALSYIWEHRKEIDGRSPAVQGALSAFPQLLTDKNDLERLQKLSDFFNKTVSQ